ncbi:MAG: hypothetical protein PSW75_05975 [bacterium]|nr:hypothetical protein [bacterium]
MQGKIIKALQERRAQIRARWEALLRIEKVTTPLANPDTLVFGLDHSLDEIFAALRQPPPHNPDAALTKTEGPSPWRAYFRAGEQALLESLVLLQAEMELLDPAARDTSFGNLKTVINNLTQREIGAWAGICQKNAKPRRARGTKKPATAQSAADHARHSQAHTPSGA